MAQEDLDAVGDLSGTPEPLRSEVTELLSSYDPFEIVMGAGLHRRATGKRGSFTLERQDELLGGAIPAYFERVAAWLRWCDRLETFAMVYLAAGNVVGARESLASDLQPGWLVERDDLASIEAVLQHLPLILMQMHDRRIEALIWWTHGAQGIPDTLRADRQGFKESSWWLGTDWRQVGGRRRLLLFPAADCSVKVVPWVTPSSPPESPGDTRPVYAVRDLWWEDWSLQLGGKRRDPWSLLRGGQPGMAPLWADMAESVPVSLRGAL